MQKNINASPQCKRQINGKIIEFGDLVVIETKNDGFKIITRWFIGWVVYLFKDMEKYFKQKDLDLLK